MCCQDVCQKFLFLVKRTVNIFTFLKVYALRRPPDDTQDHTYVLCRGLMAWWNNYIQDTKHRIVHRHCCCFTNVPLMWIVSGSPGPVRSLSPCISADWSRHKLITITHWSNWPSPDHRVAANRLVRESIAWSEEVGAASRDTEEGGGMFCRRSIWLNSTVSGCVLVHLSYSLCSLF